MHASSNLSFCLRLLNTEHWRLNRWAELEAKKKKKRKKIKWNNIAMQITKWQHSYSATNSLLFMWSGNNSLPSLKWHQRTLNSNAKSLHVTADTNEWSKRSKKGTRWKLNKNWNVPSAKRQAFNIITKWTENGKQLYVIILCHCLFSFNHNAKMIQ